MKEGYIYLDQDRAFLDTVAQLSETDTAPQSPTNLAGRMAYLSAIHADLRARVAIVDRAHGQLRDKIMDTSDELNRRRKAEG